jgi:8-oxo-dGTP pyrophosphatase MutT (NUDIX family)
MTEAKVIPLDRLECTVAPWSWDFTRDRRAEIDAFFAEQQSANPTLWNGRLLLLNKVAVAAGVMRASFFETDYASLIAGIAWRAIGREVRASFGVSALVSSDQVFVTGLMADDTRNAGMICFPSGSLEPADVVDGRVDFDASVRRELEEETGLAADDLDWDSGWYGVDASQRFPLFKIARARETAAALRERILANLARQSQAEFTDIYLVRNIEDIHPAMPNWMVAFLEFVWR